MKKITGICLTLLLTSLLFWGESCKSGKLDCPAYSDNPAPSGIPKGGKTKSSVIPPDYKKKR
ncbi:MAG: hypothetical protein KF872_07075 [Chitinophagales bacterium]|nr:hypothetical protein [Chitinophagales bacterium]